MQRRNFLKATALGALATFATGICPEGTFTNALTDFVDIYPTLCNLPGIALRPELKGTSQYPHRRNKKNVMGYAYRDQRYRYVEWEQKKFREGETTGPHGSARALRL